MIETKDGQVFRDGALIGAVDGNNLVVPDKLHHKTRDQIERETGLTVITAGVAPAAQSLAQQETPKELPAGSPFAVGTVEVIVETGKEAKEIIEQGPQKAKEIAEPEPQQDHRGDKTPAWVDWLHRHNPEGAAKRYANRKISR
jgi:hypothetical protein